VTERLGGVGRAALPASRRIPLTPASRAFSSTMASFPFTLTDRPAAANPRRDRFRAPAPIPPSGATQRRVSMCDAVRAAAARRSLIAPPPRHPREEPRVRSAEPPHARTGASGRHLHVRDGRACSSFAAGHAVHLIQSRLVSATPGEWVDAIAVASAADGTLTIVTLEGARSNCGTAPGPRRPCNGCAGRVPPALSRAPRRRTTLQRARGLSARGRCRSGGRHHRVLDRHARVHAGAAGVRAHGADGLSSACIMHMSMHV
jgi:hypothetical protein